MWYKTTRTEILHLVQTYIFSIWDTLSTIHYTKQDAIAIYSFALKSLLKASFEKSKITYITPHTWKFLKCDWLRPVVFQWSFNYLFMKITVTIRLYSLQRKEPWFLLKSLQIFKCNKWKPKRRMTKMYVADNLQFIQSVVRVFR